MQKASATVALEVSPQPSMAGQPVTLTARVAVASPGQGIPTGVVVLRDQGASSGIGDLQADGTATLVVDSLAVGSHSFSATQDAVASSRQPSRAGRPVAFTATVTSANLTPTGTATFKDGEEELGRVSLTGGAVTLTVRGLKKGTHAITVVYGEAEGFTGSTGTLADGQVIENTWAWHRIAVPWRAAVHAVVALLHLVNVVRVRNLLVRVLTPP